MTPRILASALLLIPLVTGDPAPARASEVCERKPSSDGAVSHFAVLGGQRKTFQPGSLAGSDRKKTEAPMFKGLRDFRHFKECWVGDR